MFTSCLPFFFNVGFNLHFECGIMDIINSFIAILGFLFAIYQFREQNEENRKSIVEQNNKNWYLTVLVIPQLERINNFFDVLVQDLKEYKKNTNNNDLLLRAKEQMKQKEKISAFFAPLEASISSYDNVLREKISNLGLSLQDETTNIISEANLDISVLESRVIEHKGKLIGLLYQPINQS